MNRQRKAQLKGSTKALLLLLVLLMAAMSSTTTTTRRTTARGVTIETSSTFGFFFASAASSPTRSFSSSASFLVLASSQPPPSYPSWRDPRFRQSAPSSSLQQQQQYRTRSSQGSYYRAATEDYSTHFLDSDTWMNDPRSRLFTANLKSRRPGKLSLTTKIVWMNVLAYAVQAFSPGFTSWGIKISDRILKGGEWHRLLTPMFLHGGIAHLGTNMYSLNRVGNDVERIFGPGRYVALYVASGIAGTLASAILSPNPSLGASGAVFGVVGAYFTFLTRNSWLLGPVGESMSSSIAQTMFMNVAYGLVNPVIDNWAHLGGALGGAAMAYYFGPRLYVCDDLEAGERLLIDRPMIRLPRVLEAVPEKVGTRMQRIARRMQVTRYKADLPDTPWRRKGQGQVPPHRRPFGGDVPNRSIKPRKFD
jgi:membrane associated rhomboid family serine protease